MATQRPAEIKNILQNLISKSKTRQVNYKSFTELAKVDKVKKKYDYGISKYLDIQNDSKHDYDKDKSVLTLIAEKEKAKQEDYENFKSEKIVSKIKKEVFNGSLLVSSLGKSKVWKPDKFKIKTRLNKMNV